MGFCDLSEPFMKKGELMLRLILVTYLIVFFYFYFSTLALLSILFGICLFLFVVTGFIKIFPTFGSDII